MGANPAPFGGWAVISVENLPEYLVAGRPAELTFTILQHGQTPMNDLSPTLTLRQKGDRRIWGRQSVEARRTSEPGQYVASVLLRDSGSVQITIDANWHTAETTLLPIRVVGATGTAAALAPEDRGRDLFVARGCVSCHAKRDDRSLLGRTDVRIGPELTNRAFDREWLATKLADPARNRVRMNEYVEMPDLGLDEREVAALVSYLNRPAPATSDATASRSGS
jgi:hypothetical protein